MSRTDVHCPPCNHHASLVQRRTKMLQTTALHPLRINSCIFPIQQAQPTLSVLVKEESLMTTLIHNNSFFHIDDTNASGDQQIYTSIFLWARRPSSVIPIFPGLAAFFHPIILFGAALFHMRILSISLKKNTQNMVKNR